MTTMVREIYRAVRRTKLQSQWICITQRIRVHVQIRIQPALEPDGIRLHVTPELRVVIAEVVVDLRPG